MNSRITYIRTVFVVCIFAACSSAKNVGSNSEKQIHALDSLPVTIIETQTDISDSAVFMDTTSSIIQRDFIFSFSDNFSAMSESCIIAISKGEQFENNRLSHIDFQELNFAVADFRNINYLTLDF
jgi:hypothetical protein